MWKEEEKKKLETTKKSKRQEEVDKLINDTNYLIDLVIKEHEHDRISEKEMKLSISRFRKALKMNLEAMNVDIEDVDDRIHKFRAPKPKNVDEIIRESMINGKKFKNYNSGRKRLY